ncbi:type A2 lantipeptide [Streptomyces sp. JJ38]|uniref:type A2 lantipeptide n=1 Tax=Streptomyces sp. JJ38 TaxID=2738128 RepID=UPI001C566609|nr:type A2 lantipeptide [Streptomyces sp. JJ38]MBW1597077.1 type A2 lantipeptide [Streptomyces sp. JJ38]
MDFAPQIETREIDDAELDNVAGGVAGASVNAGGALDVTAMADVDGAAAGLTAPVAGLAAPVAGLTGGVAGAVTGSLSAGL